MKQKQLEYLAQELGRSVNDKIRKSCFKMIMFILASDLAVIGFCIWFKS